MGRKRGSNYSKSSGSRGKAMKLFAKKLQKKLIKISKIARG